MQHITYTIVNNTKCLFGAAHQMARELRANWPMASYRDLFRAALKEIWAAIKRTQSKVSDGLRAAATKGIQGVVRAFRMINSMHPETIKSALLAAANKGLCTHALAYLQYAQQHRAEVLNKDLVREALLNAGGYEWTKKGRRIYISRFVKTVVANYDAFGRRGKYDCDHMYYDCETREWVGTPCNVIFAEGFAA